MPGRCCLLQQFTRRFRLGFALLRGGSRINQVGSFVSGGMSTCVFHPHAPYHTCLRASESSQDYPPFLIPLLGPPARTLLIRACFTASPRATLGRVRPRLTGPSLIFKWCRCFKPQCGSVLWATTDALPLSGATHAFEQVEVCYDEGKITPPQCVYSSWC